METLSADMANLMTSSSRKGTSLMDVVGADVNSSYDRSMQYQIVSDTFHISTGGQPDIGGNVGIQIQLRDDNAVHYLKRSGIAFDAVVEGYVHNAAMFFTGLELTIGGVTVSTPFQHYYVQQRLSKMGQKRLEPYHNGLCLDLKQAGQNLINVAGGTGL